MLKISNHITIPDIEIEMNAIRAQGTGGQSVNKVSSAIHLRFDINASSLPDDYKGILLQLTDRRVSREGIIVIKALRYRSQEKNREDALTRLQMLIEEATITTKKRTATKPTKASKKRRLQGKTLRGKLKVLRGRVEE